MNDTVPIAALIALAAVGIVLAALLAAGESALSRVPRSMVQDLEAAGARSAGRVRKLLERRQSAVAALGAVRALAEMTVAVCVTFLAAALSDVWWHVLLIAIGVSAVIVVLLTGAGPRVVGRSHPDRVISSLSGLFVSVSALAQPFVVLAGAMRPATQRGEAIAREEKAEELRDMVALVGANGDLEQSEREMLESVFELGRTLVREVMVPRTDMVTISADTPLRKAVRLFVRSGYSRIPVVGESVDDVCGVIFFKDVVSRAHGRPDAEDLPVTEVMREAVFVPETKPAGDLLREMQAGSYHLALVVDEYGGIAGLVTVEDLLEELVGEITDEHDRALPEVQQVSEDSYRVPARMPIDELGDLFGLDLSDDDVDSVGGLLAKALGRVPLVGAEVDVHGLHLVAERAEGRRRRISWILASKIPQAADEEPAAEELVEEAQT